MKRNCIFICLVLFLSVNVFSKSVYDTADEETKATLSEIDKLIEQQQYLTAFYKTSDDNEYLLAKRIEISIYAFAYSIMHQLFAIKDLEEGETLYQVRTSDGEYSIVMGDPVKSVEEFEESHGEKPILKYILGLYYQDVIDRYGDQWLLTTDELKDKVILNLQKALDQDCYDSYSLSVLATSYYQKKNLDKAIEIYQLKQKEFEFTATDNYHYGILLWYTDKAKDGLSYVIKSIDGYYDYPQFQCDAYVVASRIALELLDLKSAEKYLTECKKKYPDDYRAFRYTIALCALQNNKKKTVEASMKIFDYGISNPATCQMIMNECNDSGKPEFAVEFFKEALKKYGKDDKACENLYFHFAYQYYLMKMPSESKQMANTARGYFEKNGDLSQDVEEILNMLCENQ